MNNLYKGVKQFIIKGLVLGVIAGLLVTLFDGFFMLTPKTYVPCSYPLLLITFNTLLWTVVGGLSGFVLWAFARKREVIREKESFYWVLLFLLPFALIYGIMGKISLLASPSSVSISLSPGFDHHISFAWVSLFLAYIIIRSRVGGLRKDFTPLSLMLEIATLILLFQFCSNLPRIQIISAFHLNHQEFFQNIKVGYKQYLNMVYMAGVLLIAVFYVTTLYATRSLTRKASSRCNFSVIGTLFVITIICLAGLFIRNYTSHTREVFTRSASEQILKTRKVPQVILIVMDTVRADRLPMYSHCGVTENLEDFSRNALVFENCIAPSPWTLPSHASLFTGMYPVEHGSHGVLNSNNRGGKCRTPTRSLREEFVTLAEIFRDNGYKTAAVVSNRGALHTWHKIDQGFQYYDIRRNIGFAFSYYQFRPLLHLFCFATNLFPKYIKHLRTADDINRETFRLLDKLSPSPFFLFINYMDAHSPYFPPRPFDGYFVDTAFPQLYRLRQYLMHFGGKLSKASWDAYQLSQYDGEITYLDTQLGELFYRLKQKGIYDSSLIIITSDHGELFGEHGSYGHKVPMYEGVVRIPLIIKFPFSKRVGREKRKITLADLYPTILSLCDLPIADGISGKALGNDSFPVVSELYNCEIGEHRILYDGKYKYMGYQYGKGPELYDLDKDPIEQENLTEALPAVTMAMEAKLSEWKRSHKPKYTPSDEGEELIPKEVLEGLRALGYIK